MSFTRDRVTWLSYLMIGYFAYFQSVNGPLMPFLRDELNLNYTVAALHLSALAFGMVLAGAFGDTVTAWLGRRAVFWGGGAGLSLGAVLLILGQHPVLTIGGTLIEGTFGGLLMVSVQAALSDRHGDFRAYALTEANIMAAAAATTGPLLIGLFATTFIGWRGAVITLIAAWLLLAWRFHRIHIPLHVEDETQDEQARRGPLPPVFWAYLLAIFMGVSIEWCVVFWAAEFLDSHVGLPTEQAALLTSVMFGAILISRFTASRLTRRVRPSRLLLAAIGVTSVGFPLYWLAPVAVLNVVGLFIAGLGIANLFPLGLAAGTNAVPHQPDKASARISMTAGAAILLAPQVLGSMADAVGIYDAYAIVILLLVLALLATAAANRLGRPSAALEAHSAAD